MITVILILITSHTDDGDNGDASTAHCDSHAYTIIARLMTTIVYCDLHQIAMHARTRRTYYCATT